MDGAAMAERAGAASSPRASGLEVGGWRGLPGQGRGEQQRRRVDRAPVARPRGIHGGGDGPGVFFFFQIRVFR